MFAGVHIARLLVIPGAVGRWASCWFLRKLKVAVNETVRRSVLKPSCQDTAAF